MSIIQQVFISSPLSCLNVFIGPWNVCCCGYESICLVTWCWPVSKLKNSKAFYWLCGCPASTYVLRSVDWARSSSHMQGKVIFCLPYFTVFLAFTRELSPNTLRYPLHIRINFSLMHPKLRKDPLRSGSVFCAVEPALKNTGGLSSRPNSAISVSSLSK